MGIGKVNRIMRKAMIQYNNQKESYNDFLETARIEGIRGNSSNEMYGLKSRNSKNSPENDSFGLSQSSEGFGEKEGGNDTSTLSPMESALSNSSQDTERYLQEIASNTGVMKNQINNGVPMTQPVPQPIQQAPIPQQIQPQPQPQSQSQPQVAQVAQPIPTYAQPQQIPAQIQVQGIDGINVDVKNYIDPSRIENMGGNSDFDDESSKKHMKLAKVPDNLINEAATNWEPINYRGVDTSYDLYDLSRVEIKFDEKEQKILYKIIEPELTDGEQEKLDYLKKAFIYVFDKVSPDNIAVSGKELIVDRAKKLAVKYKLRFTDEEFRNVSYYLVRDFLGLDILEPILHDPFIEDVSCDGLGVPIFVNHLKYGPLEVNRRYDDPAKLNSFIIKLAQKSNQEVSLSRPILQGALPDGSRVEAIYGKEISEKGSSYTIRKFREEPFTPIHLIEFGTMPSFLLAYLWLAVENRKSILVSGGTATGKTTALNALSLFAPPTSKIVSIEDTPEINLPHEHWLSLISRESDGKAQVSMFDLLKASLRERPDYIIVGEIRGAEAAILFQGMATGHAGMGTVHAEKFPDLVNRMTIEPINLPPQLITELDICIFIKQVKIKNNMVRRVQSVVEVGEYNKKTDKFGSNEFLKFLPQKDEFEISNSSAVMEKLIQGRGGSEDSLWTEIEKRRRILDFMHKNKILEFEQVADVIRAYYKEPAGIFDYIEKYSPSNKEPVKEIKG